MTRLNRDRLFPIQWREKSSRTRLLFVGKDILQRRPGLSASCPAEKAGGGDTSGVSPSKGSSERGAWRRFPVLTLSGSPASKPKALTDGR